MIDHVKYHRTNKMVIKGFETMLFQACVFSYSRVYLTLPVTLLRRHDTSEILTTHQKMTEPNTPIDPLKSNLIN